MEYVLGFRGFSAFILHSSHESADDVSFYATAKLYTALCCATRKGIA